MNSITTQLEGIELLIPDTLVLPWDTIEEFPSCCGPGEGWKEKAIPESVWGLRISPCCWIHDNSWRLAVPTWADFHQSNAMFLTNMISMIQMRPSPLFVVDWLRIYRAATYYNVVEKVGADVFWELKKENE